ncbi:hypothetical protein ABPG74_002880 [Tetrahymena malaccensis]
MYLSNQVLAYQIGISFFSLSYTFQENTNEEAIKFQKKIQTLNGDQHSQKNLKFPITYSIELLLYEAEFLFSQLSHPDKKTRTSFLKFNAIYLIQDGTLRVFSYLKISGSKIDKIECVVINRCMSIHTKIVSNKVNSPIHRIP